MGYQVDMGPLERSGMRRANTLQGLGKTIGGAIGGYQQRGEQEKKQAQMQELMQAAASGDQQAINTLYSINPTMGKQMEERMFAGQTRQTDERAMVTADLIEKMAFSSPDVQQRLFEAAVVDERYDIDEDDRNLFMIPKYQQAAIAKAKGEDYANRLFAKEGGSDSLPAEAIAFNDLIKDFNPKEKSLAKRVKAGLKGRAVSNAVMTGIVDGTIDTYSDAMATIKEESKFAEMTGSSRAKAIDSGIESIRKIDTGLSNIDAAIEAVSKGAGTGFIEKKFPSLTASSIELDNIQKRMALDVIGAVTFGALSQGELDLAKEVALPTGLEGPDLIKHLQGRKLAQQKLKDYYNEQIQFLDQGGTVAGFIRAKERGQNEAPQNTPVNTPPSGRQGGVLSTDAQGNKAFVFPDGSFEEVQ